MPSRIGAKSTSNRARTPTATAGTAMGARVVVCIRIGGELMTSSCPRSVHLERVRSGRPALVVRRVRPVQERHQLLLLADAPAVLLGQRAQLRLLGTQGGEDV